MPVTGAALPPQQAHVGVILPAVNRVCERQFHAYAPTTLGIHTMRARIGSTLPVEELAGEIQFATRRIAECQPDLLVYNCTGSSMRDGLKGERRIMELMREAADIDAISTSAMITEAFHELGIKSVVVISPYSNNNNILGYLNETGIKVVRDVALGLTPTEYGSVTPLRWQEIARENNVKNADGIFLSCAATTQIESVAAIESELDKPVVNSNQSVLWGCLKRMKPKLGTLAPMPQLGSLMKSLEG